MSDISKTLKVVQDALKPKPQNPKLTTEQCQQLAKVNMTLALVLQGKLTLKDLENDSKEMLLKLSKTFIDEAATKSIEYVNSLS